MASGWLPALRFAMREHPVSATMAATRTRPTREQRWTTSHSRLAYDLQPVDGGTRVVLEQDNNPTSESAEHGAENWRSMLDGLTKTAASGDSQRVNSVGTT